jgi:hypothetical protein
MSERSKKLARCIRRARGCSAETKQDNRDELLDKGFAYLKIDLASEFHNQIIEVNHEPGCVGTLGSTFTDKESSAFKIGEEYKGLSIRFDPNERTAEIKGREPVAFYYLIQVRLSQDQTTWSYAGTGRDGEPVPIRGKLDNLVEKALFALFGVDA